MIKALTDRARNYFGRYVAAESNNRRRDPGARVQSSDLILSETGRGRLTEGARELWRNYSTVAWAIRKHLDYVATFSFLPTTGDPELNAELARLMDWWGRPLNFDIASRHSMARYMRLLEARRVIDGDVFLVKLKSGKLQAIEGHRVRTPQNASAVSGDWVHGVRVGPGGKLLSVAVHTSDRTGLYKFEREVTAGNVIQFGYFDAFDQVRGVSPLASAITQFQDVLEVSEYARAKAKITQLFALAITRETADFDDDDDGSGEYQIDFGKGPVKIEMDPGDKAEFLESRHPSTEFVEFIKVTLQAALKALDIPWSFFDEGYTNFFGSKSALMQYQQSCVSKRQDLRELLDRITVWRMAQWISNGVLQLPAGMTLGDLSWDWVPAGIPWWDVQKEVAGDLAAIEGGLRTRTEIRRERFGDDWRDVARKLAEEKEFLDELGLDVSAASKSVHIYQRGDGNQLVDEPGPDVEDSADEGAGDPDIEDGGEGVNDPGA